MAGSEGGRCGDGRGGDRGRVGEERRHGRDGGSTGTGESDVSRIQLQLMKISGLGFHKDDALWSKHIAFLPRPQSASYL